jgi:hypothetical protein
MVMVLEISAAVAFGFVAGRICQSMRRVGAAHWFRDTAHRVHSPAKRRWNLVHSPKSALSAITIWVQPPLAVPV